MKDRKTWDALDRDRPYERCLLKGPSSLSDAELLAVIIRTGTNGMNAVTLAEKLLETAGREQGIAGIMRLTASEMMKLPGIGQVKAVQLMCVGELSKRISAFRARKSLLFSDPETISRYFMEQLRHEEQELLVLVMLDTRLGAIGEKILTRGTVNASMISVREIFMTALRNDAVNIVLVHNHPSGDPSPSGEDVRVTSAVHEAGKLMGITLLDHVIIGDGTWFSFQMEGYLS